MRQTRRYSEAMTVSRKRVLFHAETVTLVNALCCRGGGNEAIRRKGLKLAPESKFLYL